MPRTRALTVAALTVASMAAGGQAPPVAWVPAFIEERHDPNALRRANSADRYLMAWGDFNGDGLTDRALVAATRTGDEAAVLIYLNGEEPPVIVQRLAPEAIGGVGITTVKAGDYAPACARQIGIDCAATTRVQVPHEALNVFAFEGHSTYFWLEGTQLRTLPR